MSQSSLLTLQRAWTSLLAILPGVLLIGCLPNYKTDPPVTYYQNVQPANLSAEITDAATRLISVKPELAQYSPMIASTFVDINNLRVSSTFGRISSELFASALSQAGVRMREVKMRDSLFVEEKLGELILTREVKRLNAAYSANSILMGTYAVGSNRVYISVRVVNTRDSMVLATADLSLPLDNNLRAMLDEKGW
ncbi:FlgO family outer membrane protein [Halochromatium roseum]|uniref:FlgO family outer membrane protein n=1 Tax=Halochromatium roseum TaxID=391920 RepID=UPI001913A3CE|nr:FlgO family outer membrane protein [Halochromatium roseum]MBK5939549.1 hypothetical protein [Halochromatium roseum]